MSDIIICRPEPKAGQLVAQLQAKGLSARALIPFVIKPVFFDFPAIASKTDIIFTSTYAVDALIEHYCIKELRKKIQKKQVKLWAIGQSTQSKLAQNEFFAQIPDDSTQINSEGLIETIKEYYQHYSDRHFILLKGCAGRDYLEAALIQEAKSIQVINCYQRIFNDQKNILSKIKKINLKQARSKNGLEGFPAIIVYTSFDALRATLSLYEYYPSWRHKVWITVTNRRMLTWAEEQGFDKIYLLECFSADSIASSYATLLKKEL